MHKQCPNCGSQYPSFEGKCLVCDFFIQLNYFDVLGINITNNTKEIKKSYYKKIMQCHPDKVEKLSQEFQRLANKKTRQLNYIWNKLKNDTLRKDYIESLHEYFNCCNCNHQNKLLISHNEKYFYCSNCENLVDKHGISARFLSTKIKHGVRDKYTIGMSIAIDFTICNTYEEMCKITVYLYNDSPLEKNNIFYKRKNGYFSSTHYFIPNYTNATYQDFTFFIPYHKLYLDVGKSKFKFLIIIHDDEENEVSISNWFYFKNRLSF
jgi:curved DNA-binding protein CbpA